MRVGAIMGGVAALAVGWYAVSPFWAQHQLQLALDSGDSAEIAREVDFPAVRASLKDQLDQRIGGAAGTNVLAQFGAVIAATVSDRMVDWLVTPEGLRRILATGHAAPSGAEAGNPGPSGDPAGQTPRETWHVAWRSLDRFELVGDGGDSGGNGGAPPRLVFRRDGLGWVLSGVVLPDANPADAS